VSTSNVISPSVPNITLPARAAVERGRGVTHHSACEFDSPLFRYLMLDELY
jgi:hypothetical protein